MQGITPEQIAQMKNSISLLEAEITMQQLELDTWIKRGGAERAMFTWLADKLIDPGHSRRPLAAYLDAHKANFDAMGQLKELSIVRLKSQLAITSEMLKEADRVVKEPMGPGIVTVSN